MFLALVLAASAATPPPAASSLTPLKVIGSVRSTPICSALRTKIGPAIAALLANDATIGQGAPLFQDMYRNALLNASGGWEQWSARGFINRGRLEYLIGPLVNNLKQIDDLLADNKIFVAAPNSADEKSLAVMKDRLTAVEAHQKAALNAISGYHATSLLRELQSTDISQGLHVSQPSQRSMAPFNSIGFSDEATNRGAITMQGPRSTPGRFDVSLAYDPFRPFEAYLTALRAEGVADETAAAEIIGPIAASCQAK